MDLSTQSSLEDLSRVESPRNGSSLFSSDSVLSILKLILAGSPLPEKRRCSFELTDVRRPSAICLRARETSCRTFASSIRRQAWNRGGSRPGGGQAQTQV